MPSTNENQAPKGLFERVMRRLGLEKQLAFLRRRMDWSLIGSAAVFFLAMAALYLAIDFLLRTSFFDLVSLVLDDPQPVFMHWRPFVLAVSENLPGFFTAAVLFCLGVVMVLVRLASIYSVRISNVIRQRKELTNKQ
jgi:hypothetical protein